MEFLNNPQIQIAFQLLLAVFLGAGLIIYRQLHVEDLTTAAGFWIVTGIGITVAVRFYWMAVFATLITIIILAGLRLFEERLEEKYIRNP